MKGAAIIRTKGAASGVARPAGDVQADGMATSVKLSQQPRTESYVAPAMRA